MRAAPVSAASAAKVSDRLAATATFNPSRANSRARLAESPGPVPTIRAER